MAKAYFLYFAALFSFTCFPKYAAIAEPSRTAVNIWHEIQIMILFNNIVP